MTDNKTTHKCDGCEKDYPMDDLLRGWDAMGAMTYWCEPCYVQDYEELTEEEQEDYKKQLADWKAGKKFWEYYDCCECGVEHHQSEYHHYRPFLDSRGEGRPVCDACVQKRADIKEMREKNKKTRENRRIATEKLMPIIVGDYEDMGYTYNEQDPDGFTREMYDAEDIRDDWYDRLEDNSDLYDEEWFYLIAEDMKTGNLINWQKIADAVQDARDNFLLELMFDIPQDTLVSAF